LTVTLEQKNPYFISIIIALLPYRLVISNCSLGNEQKLQGLNLEQKYGIIVLPKSAIQHKLSMTMFNAGMVTTLKRMHLVTSYKSPMKVNQFLVSTTLPLEL
jgi:hypothetical protein